MSGYDYLFVVIKSLVMSAAPAYLEPASYLSENSQVSIPILT